MACPSGCLNGGAQIRPRDGVAVKDLMLTLENIYSSLPLERPEENKKVQQLYETWLNGQESDKCNALLHTEYHAVEKMPNALNIKW